MVIRNRTLKDLRGNSRVTTFMNCLLTHKNATYDAVIVDLSQKGALLSSDFMPPTGENISIIIRSNLIKKDLSLGGRVIRGAMETNGEGDKRGFVVQFDQCPLDLINLITEFHRIQKKNEAQLNDWWGPIE